MRGRYNKKRSWMLWRARSTSFAPAKTLHLEVKIQSVSAQLSASAKSLVGISRSSEKVSLSFFFFFFAYSPKHHQNGLSGLLASFQTEHLSKWEKPLLYFRHLWSASQNWAGRWAKRWLPAVLVFSCFKHGPDTSELFSLFIHTWRPHSLARILEFPITVTFE